MLTAVINVNGKEITLTGTEKEIKQAAVSHIRFENSAEQDQFLKELVIEPEISNK